MSPTFWQGEATSLEVSLFVKIGFQRFFQTGIKLFRIFLGFVQIGGRQGPQRGLWSPPGLGSDNHRLGLRSRPLQDLEACHHNEMASDDLVPGGQKRALSSRLGNCLASVFHHAVSPILGSSIFCE